jgi:sulfide:quinone oxidoreductase
VARVIVAGGGFGGISTAVALRDRIGSAHEIVVVDRRETFVMGLRKTWAIVGESPLSAGTRRLDALGGIETRHGSIQSIEPDTRAIVVDGERLEADALVLALGADHAPGAIPGLAEHGIDAWDPDQADRAHAALAGIGGGRLLIGVFGTPYPCPPGPYELALLAKERHPDAEVAVFAPMPITLPIAGPAECSKLDAELAEAGVGFLAGHQATEVNPGTVRFADGSERGFDLLLAVPPHRAPSVLVDAGLAQPGGWAKVDPRTLETGVADVYAIGDATAIMLANGMPLPKAGLLAELEGTVVAARIADRLAGVEPTTTFDGEAFCFIETGGGRAMMVGGRFLDDPPDVQVTPASEELRQRKVAFERERLVRWFGA